MISFLSSERRVLPVNALNSHLEWIACEIAAPMRLISSSVSIYDSIIKAHSYTAGLYNISSSLDMYALLVENTSNEEIIIENSILDESEFGFLSMGIQSCSNLDVSIVNSSIRGGRRHHNEYGFFELPLERGSLGLTIADSQSIDIRLNGSVLQGGESSPMNESWLRANDVDIVMGTITGFQFAQSADGIRVIDSTARISGGRALGGKGRDSGGFASVNYTLLLSPGSGGDSISLVNSTVELVGTELDPGAAGEILHTDPSMLAAQPGVEAAVDEQSNLILLSQADDWELYE